jgi:T4-like virus tail tube protein gp19
MGTSLMGWVNNTQEPKRLNRYELLLTDALRLTCNSVTMPKISVEEVDIHRMHNYYKLAGSKIKYEDITVVFYDFIDNSAAMAIEAWWTQVYNVNTTLMGFAATYKQNITLLCYGPDDSVVESWVLVGAWPQNYSRKDLKWDDANGHQEITLTLKIDEAQVTLS